MIRQMIWILLLSICTLFGCSEAGVSDDQQKTNTSSAEKVQAAGNQEEVEKKKDNLTKSYEPPSEIIKDKREGIKPVRIDIPAIGVNTKVEHLGLLENGQMDVPDGYDNVSWFEPGVKPGQPGNAVIAGHVDDTVNPAVFYDLKKLEEGDEIILTGENGKKLTFIVYNKEVFPYDQSPVKELFGYSHRSLLNLITCIGDYNQEVNGRENRLVVYTELKQE